MKIAIIYDWLTNRGGAERLLFSLLKVFPQADIFTMIYNPRVFPELKNRKITTSFLNHLPFAKRYWPIYAPLMPYAVENFDLRGYNLVISLSWSFSKGVLTKPETIHVGYLCTPTRFLWYPQIDQRAPSNPLARRIINYLKNWDLAAADRVDFYFAISSTTAQRIEEIYQRRAKVIYPPIGSQFFRPANKKKGNYFLFVSRLIPYKRADLAILACQKLSLPLKVVGQGPQLPRLKKLAQSPQIQFYSHVSDKKLRDLYQRAQAVIFCSEEDFGLVPLEAMATGTPVIAYQKGGASETVTAQTGILFKKQEVESLIGAIQLFLSRQFKIKDLQAQALKFSQSNFKKTFLKEINNVLKWRKRGKIWV